MSLFTTFVNWNLFFWAGLSLPHTPPPPRPLWAFFLMSILIVKQFIIAWSMISKLSIYQFHSYIYFFVVFDNYILVYVFALQMVFIFLTEISFSCRNFMKIQVLIRECMHAYCIYTEEIYFLYLKKKNPYIENSLDITIK